MVYARISCRGHLKRRPAFVAAGDARRSERVPDARARRAKPSRGASGTLMGGLGGRREIAHNGRPRRTIGRLCCSIARNAGVRYAPLVFGEHRAMPNRPSDSNEGPDL